MSSRNCDKRCHNVDELFISITVITTIIQLTFFILKPSAVLPGVILGLLSALSLSLRLAGNGIKTLDIFVVSIWIIMLANIDESTGCFILGIVITIVVEIVALTRANGKDD